jgi:hypothetical protein
MYFPSCPRAHALNNPNPSNTAEAKTRAIMPTTDAMSKFLKALRTCGFPELAVLAEGVALIINRLNCPLIASRDPHQGAF